MMPTTNARNRLTVTCCAIAGYLILLVIGVAANSAHAAEDRTVTVAGRGLDPLGGVLADARVTLMRDGQRVTDANSDQSGRFALGSSEAGRYRVRVEAQGF